MTRKTTLQSRKIYLYRNQILTWEPQNKDIQKHYVEVHKRRPVLSTYKHLGLIVFCTNRRINLYLTDKSSKLFCTANTKYKEKFGTHTIKNSTGTKIWPEFT